METVNSLLNLLGLGFWISAVVLRRYAVSTSRPLTLLSTLRSENPHAQNQLLWGAGLLALLLLRSLAYWYFSPADGQGMTVDFGTLTISFLSNSLGQMLTYSLISFVLFFFLYHLWLMGLSLSSQGEGRTDSFEKLINQQLGWIAEWHAGWKILLAFVAGIGFWLAIGNTLLAAESEAIPDDWSFTVLLKQSPLVSLSLTLSFLIVVLAVLILYTLNNYVYLGDWAIWNYIDRAAAFYLYPLRVVPLFVGRVDLSPLLGIVCYGLIYRFARFQL